MHASSVCSPTWFITSVSMQLRLGDRRDDLEDRLLGEDRHALRDRVDVAGEAEALEPLQERLGEAPSEAR